MSKKLINLFIILFFISCSAKPYKKENITSLEVTKNKSNHNQNLIISNDFNKTSKNNVVDTNISKENQLYSILQLGGTSSFIGIIQSDNDSNQIFHLYPKGLIPCNNSQSCDEYEKRISYYFGIMDEIDLKNYLHTYDQSWINCKKNNECNNFKKYWPSDEAYFYSVSLNYYESDNLFKAKYFGELAANEGYARAQHFLGIMFDSRFIENSHYKDNEKALFWYKMAADNNHPDSMLNLATLYNSEVIGNKKDVKKYFYYLEKASNFRNVDAMFLLGQAYENGLGTDVDYKKSLKWYKAAAKFGDLQSMYNVGVFYTKGRGVTIDYCKAIKWYRIAAEGGMPEAQHNLANRLILGQCVEKNINRAKYWYEKAAKNNYIPSINMLNEYFNNTSKD